MKKKKYPASVPRVICAVPKFVKLAAEMREAVTKDLKIVTQPRHPWLDLLLTPPPRFDFRKWRRSDGQHCETEGEAEKRKDDWVKLLMGGYPEHGVLAERLSENDHAFMRCGLSFCPVCLRNYRINLVWQALEVIIQRYPYLEKNLVTLVHETGKFGVGKLHNASFKTAKNYTRQILRRALLGSYPVIGGFDISFNEDSARKWEWHYQLHTHLIFIGAPATELKLELRKVYPETETIPVPVSVDPVFDLMGAISYCYKAGFYRRVSYIGSRGRQTRKGLPIKPDQLREIAEFMATQTFGDRLYLQGLHRRGMTLEPEGAFPTWL